MSNIPMLLGGKDLTGAIILKPSIESFLTGKFPCHVFAFEFNKSTSLPHVNTAFM